jgi:hypothetical protein
MGFPQAAPHTEVRWIEHQQRGGVHRVDVTIVQQRLIAWPAVETSTLEYFLVGITGIARYNFHHFLHGYGSSVYQNMPRMGWFSKWAAKSPRPFGKQTDSGINEDGKPPVLQLFSPWLEKSATFEHLPMYPIENVWDCPLDSETPGFFRCFKLVPSGSPRECASRIARSCQGHTNFLEITMTNQKWKLDRMDTICHKYLVGGWPTPLKNMSSSMGRMTSHIWNGK